MLINHNLSEHQTQHQILKRRALLHVSSPSFYPPINQTNLDKIKCWFLGNQIYMHCLLLTLPKTAGFVYNLVRDDLIYSAVSIFVFHTKFQKFHHTNSAYNSFVHNGRHVGLTSWPVTWCLVCIFFSTQYINSRLHNHSSSSCYCDEKQ